MARTFCQKVSSPSTERSAYVLLNKEIDCCKFHNDSNWLYTYCLQMQGSNSNLTVQACACMHVHCNLCLHDIVCPRMRKGRKSMCTSAFVFLKKIACRCACVCGNASRWVRMCVCVCTYIEVSMHICLFAYVRDRGLCACILASIYLCLCIWIGGCV